MGQVGQQCVQCVSKKTGDDVDNLANDRSKRGQLSSPGTNVTNSERESRKLSINNCESNQTTSSHKVEGPIEGIERALAYPSEVPDDSRKLSSKKRVKKKKKSIVKGGQNTEVNLFEDEYRDESKTFFEKPDKKKPESNASSVFEMPAHL